MTINSNYLQIDASFEQNLQVLSKGQFYSKELLDTKKALSQNRYGIFVCSVLAVSILALSLIFGHYFNSYAYAGTVLIIAPISLIYFLRKKINELKSDLLQRRQELHRIYCNFIDGIIAQIKFFQKDLAQVIQKEIPDESEHSEEVNYRILQGNIQNWENEIKENYKILFDQRQKTINRITSEVIRKVNAELDDQYIPLRQYKEDDPYYNWSGAYKGQDMLFLLQERLKHLEPVLDNFMRPRKNLSETRSFNSIAES